MQRLTARDRASKRHSCAAISTLFARRAASNISLASLTLMASGFSHNTCAPFSSAYSTGSLCSEFGRQTLTASGFSASIISRQLA